MIGIAKAYKKLKPDIVVILGDRYDILQIAISCHVKNIPIAHFHGGELTHGAIDDAIRHSISKMSDIHFTAHIDFKRRLIIFMIKSFYNMRYCMVKAHIGTNNILVSYN